MGTIYQERVVEVAALYQIALPAIIVLCAVCVRLGTMLVLDSVWNAFKRFRTVSHVIMGRIVPAASSDTTYSPIPQPAHCATPH